MNQPQRQRFVAIENRVACLANGHAGLYAFAASGTFLRLSRLVIPFLPQSQVPRRAPLYIMNPISYNDSIKYLKDIGRLTGRSNQANSAAQAFLHKLAAYRAKSPKSKSLLLMYGSDVNFNIFTAGSLPGGLLAQVTPYPWPAPGPGAPAASDHEPGAIPYSLEKILATDPDVLFIASLTFAPGAQPLSKQLASNPVWSNLKAVKNHQVFEVNPSFYIFGRGTRSLSLALDDAMNRLYPDVFPTPLT